MLQRGRIASRLFYVPKTIPQILRNKVGGESAQHQLPSDKPFAETGTEGNLSVNGLWGIPLLA
jgi:hypothetical protein